jgi:ABC-type dipeptide/oligopeptide/nickel transport system permease subunit
MSEQLLTGAAVAIPDAPLTRRRSWWRVLASSPKALIGTIMLTPLAIIAIIGPAIAPYDFTEQNVGQPLDGPSSAHWFGTDIYGRDMLSRLIAGDRTAFTVAIVVGLGTLIFGVGIGLVAGYFGGWIDTIAMRIVDVMLSFPWLIVALGLVAVLGSGLKTVLIALILVYTPQLARMTRNTVGAVKSREFVEAGVAIGETTPALLLRYVLRNAYFPILVLLTSMLAFSILNEAGISFLGFGVQPPDTSWGLELAEAAQYLSVAPHLAIFPGLLIAWIVLGFNLLGDGLGDLLDENRSDA